MPVGYLLQRKLFYFSVGCLNFCRNWVPSLFYRRTQAGKQFGSSLPTLCTNLWTYLTLTLQSHQKNFFSDSILETWVSAFSITACLWAFCSKGCGSISQLQFCWRLMNYCRIWPAECCAVDRFDRASTTTDEPTSTHPEQRTIPNLPICCTQWAPFRITLNFINV